MTDLPPYGVIWNHLKKREVIPFLGAGASLSGRPSKINWNEESADFLPTGQELANRLAKIVSYPQPKLEDEQDPQKIRSYYLALAEHDDLAKVSSYYTQTADRPSLIDFMKEVFHRDYQIGKIHQFLAEIEVPLLVVSTNYDDLLERAFQEKGKPYHLVTYPTDNEELKGSVLWWEPGALKPEAVSPTKLSLTFSNTSIIFKMHGGIDRYAKRWDSFVITEEDYIEFLSRMTGQNAIPATFKMAFRNRRFLFLGYGLRDWNLRVLLNNLKYSDIFSRGSSGGEETDSVTGKLRSWAIQYGPSVVEKKLWGSRNVTIYHQDLDTFVSELRSLWKEEQNEK